MQAKQIQLMLSREQSSVVSNWDEHLGLIQISDTVWKIGTFGYEIIGSIYDLVPEDQRYDDDGELVIPESWEGKRIIGLEDGEYLQTFWLRPRCLLLSLPGRPRRRDGGGCVRAPLRVRKRPPRRLAAAPLQSAQHGARRGPLSCGPPQGLADRVAHAPADGGQQAGGGALPCAGRSCGGG